MSRVQSPVKDRVIPKMMTMGMMKMDDDDDDDMDYVSADDNDEKYSNVS